MFLLPCKAQNDGQNTQYATTSFYAQPKRIQNALVTAKEDAREKAGFLATLQDEIEKLRLENGEMKEHTTRARKASMQLQKNVILERDNAVKTVERLQEHIEQNQKDMHERDTEMAKLKDALEEAAKNSKRQTVEIKRLHEDANNLRRDLQASKIAKAQMASANNEKAEKDSEVHALGGAFEAFFSFHPRKCNSISTDHCRSSNAP